MASLVTLGIMFGLWELLSTFMVLLMLYIYTFFISMKNFTGRCSKTIAKSPSLFGWEMFHSSL